MRASNDGRVLAGLVWFHRWLGVATCLIFAMWFATGAVMVFEPFPSLSPGDRSNLAKAVELDRVAIAPAEALRLSGSTGVSALRLIQRAGAPAYVVEGDGGLRVVDAVGGARLGALSPGEVGAAQPAIDYDQWIVPNGLDSYRPVFRIDEGDAAGTTLYKSALTGEAVQRTTAAGRRWNWLGSVLHWVYFTPLRSNWSAWNQVVWWLSFVAMLVAVAGMVVGIARTARALRQARPGLTYFRLTWLRWHHLLGLFAGVFVLTWIFSGWLSMDHGRLFSRGDATAAQTATYRGQFDMRTVTPVAVRRAGPFKELRFSSVAGVPVLTARGVNGSLRRLDAAGQPLSDAQIAGSVAAGAQAAWPGARVASITPVAPGALLDLHEGWPPTVRRVRMAGGDFPDLYIDAMTGQILTVMDNSRVAYAWLYFAAHTLKFPGLAAHDSLRKSIELVLLAAGFAFSVTGVVIGWRRIRPRRRAPGAR